MNEYERALERDLGITIRRDNGKRRSADDPRFCYGATCTWFGSINEVSSTAKHPRHQQVVGHNGDLPCCPICGGMLYEMESEAEWWDSIDQFEKGNYPRPMAHAHPGYRAMWEWQKKENRCFFQGANGVSDLVKAYREATGITVDVEQ